MGGSGDAAEKTQEQISMEIRQRRQLNEEIASSERRLKATARGKLGKRSLLGQPMQPAKGPTGPLMTAGYMKDKSGGFKKIPRGVFGAALRTGRTNK